MRNLFCPQASNPQLLNKGLPFEGEWIYAKIVGQIKF